MTTSSSSQRRSTSANVGSLSNCYIPLPLATKKETLGERQKRLIATRSSGDQDARRQADPTTRTPTSAVRGAPQLRRLCLETSIIHNSDGSALVELGHTKVLAQAVGPITSTDSSTISSMEEGTLVCSVKFAPHVGVKLESIVANAVTTLDSYHLSAGKISSLLSTRETDLSSRLHAALSPAVPLQHYPKCIWNVNMTILQDDGSVLSAAIVAASLALSDANVELYDVVSSCTVAVFSECDEMLADPTQDELAAADATVTLAIMPSWKNVTLWQQSGKLSSDEASRAVDLCRDGCRTLQRFMRQCLIQHAENAFEMQQPE
jgi:exosome complex component MTR3